MLLDPMGGIVTTNDGNCILREIMVQDPAAKSMIKTARSQDAFGRPTITESPESLALRSCPEQTNLRKKSWE